MTNPIQELKEVREKIAVLEIKEAALVAQIIKEAGHTKIGEATYTLYGAKVKIATGENIKLDKALLNAVWKDTMPINRTYSYTLRTKEYAAMMKSGTPAQKKMLAEIVTTSMAKPTVKIEV